MNRRDFVKLGSAFPAAAVTATLTLKEEGKAPIYGLDVSVLKVQSGDALVLNCDDHIPQATADRIKSYIGYLLPDVKVIVLSGGLKVEGVLRGPV